MIKQKDHLATIRQAALAGVALGALLTVPTFALAQEVETTPAADETAADDDSKKEEKIVVTGSRVRKDSFSSISPLQVIDSDTIVEAGLIDTASILRSTPVVQGAQLSANVTTSFVTNGGPGANNVSLRGLASSSTLVLINGHRFAPAGVEGAPSNPDINLIPSSMVQRVDILLDGASSIYGSDAVAGVINVITKTNFEGVQGDAFISIPEDTGGRQERYSLLMGGGNDDGGYTFSAEYFHNQKVVQEDRQYTYAEGRSCNFDYEIGGNPEKRCHGGVGNVIFSALNGAVAPTTGPSDIGVPGWATVNSRDASYRDDAQQAKAYLTPSQERYSFFFNAHQKINAVEGMEAFAEASFSNSQTKNSGTPGQIFRTVPASNPFNPGFLDLTVFGFPDVEITPVIFAPFPRGDISVEVQQARLYSGVRGDLGFVNMPSWDYEAFAGYTRSIGYSSRPALLEERFDLSIGTAVRDPSTGVVTCGIPNFADRFGFASLQTCVPVNLFAPSLYVPGNPQFATQAEYDYLVGKRTVTTTIDQKIAGGFVTGPLYDLPYGQLQGVFGFEIREDGLNSGVDTIAATGGAAGFFADKNSQGSVTIKEAYGELDIPLVNGQPFMQDLSLNLSGRLIDHQLYGSDQVWGAKSAWSPVEWLTVRGTAGTSFRAPNLRELFLGGQSGFGSGFADPCVVPLNAQIAGTGGAAATYDPTQDSRNATLLANCVADGVDPTALGLAGVSSIESFRSGNRGLSPETSKSYTIGFVFDQPWSDAFDFSFSFNYFDITVKGSVVTPSTGFILSRCYNSSTFPADPFCQRRQRDPNTGLLTSVDRTPFNIAANKSSGFDFNARFGKEFSLFGREFAFTSDAVATLTDSVEQQVFAASTTVNQFKGDFGTPKWRGTMNSRITMDEWTLFWRATYIGKQANKGLFGAVVPRVENGGIPVNSVGDVFYHDVSLSYSNDDWAVRVGVNNLANRKPPLIDQDVSDATVSNSNVPLGVGYDLVGRRVFFNVTKAF